MNKTIKVYVSLPITGQESTVMERFLRAKNQIEYLFGIANTKDYELEIVPPLDIDKIGTPEQDNTKPLSYWIGEDIKLLMECDAVYVCAGYPESNGCLLEYQCADIYEKTILCEGFLNFKNICRLEDLVNELDKQGMN